LKKEKVIEGMERRGRGGGKGLLFDRIVTFTKILQKLNDIPRL